MALKAGKNGEMVITLRVKDNGTAVIEKFGKTAEREGEKSSASWGKVGAAAGVAAAAVATTAVLMVKNAIDTADATGKLADKLGMTTEAFSALAYSAKATADITRDNFGQAMRVMVDNLSQAAQGTGLAKNAIADLGLNAKQLAAMGPEKAIMAISDALEKIPNQGDRVRIAMDVFRNADMVNALRGGSAALREMMEEAKRFGQVIGRDAARQADAFNDNLDRLKASSTGLAMVLAAGLLPVLIKVSDALTRLASGGPLIKHDQRPIIQASVDQLMGFYEKALAAGQESVAAGYRTQIDALLRKLQAANESAKKELNAGNKAGEKPGGATTGANTEEIKEFAKRIAEIHAQTIGEQQKLAEDYVKNWLDLERARATGVITNDEELAARRLEISDQYQQQVALHRDTLHAQYLADMAANIEAMQESFMTEAEIEQQRYDEQLLALENYKLSVLYVEETYNALKEGTEKRHQDNVSRLQDEALRKRFGNEHAWMEQTVNLMKGDWAFKLQGIALVLGKAAQLMQSERKKEFEFGKKAAIGEALISTFLGAAKALGQYGFPVGAIFAALTVAVGMMNVRRIQSQQFGGGGSGAVPTFSASPNTGLPTGTPDGDVGLPSSTLPPQPTSVAAATPRNVNVTFLGLSGPLDAAWVRDTMIPSLNDALGDGVNLSVKA